MLGHADLAIDGDGIVSASDVFAIFPQWLATCPDYLEYNGDGLRTSQTIGKFITGYDWDVEAGLPMILQETERELWCIKPPNPCESVPGDVVSENTYVYGLDLISATDDGGNQRYYFTDGLGSTVRTVMPTTEGLKEATYGYDVFGAVRLASELDDPSDKTFLFTGEQYDARARGIGETGLYYLRARYYDPTIGRFLSQDPLPGGNLYAYVRNNPVRFVDPSGLCIPGINRPPGLGGGTQPPSLARPKEGGNFANVNLEDVCWYQYPLCVHVIMDGYHQLCAMNDRAEVLACQKLRPAGTPLASQVLEGIQKALTDPACVGWSVVAVTSASVTIASAYGVIVIPASVATTTQMAVFTGLVGARAVNKCLDAIERSD